MKMVVKVGTSTLAHATGRLNIRLTGELCKVLSDLKNMGHEVILVSSGAIGMGFIEAVMTDSSYAALREAIGLNENSVVLMFSTEGATDPDNYRRIVGKDI